MQEGDLPFLGQLHDRAHGLHRPLDLTDLEPSGGQIDVRQRLVVQRALFTSGSRSHVAIASRALASATWSAGLSGSHIRVDAEW